MMKKVRTITALLVLTALLAGCGKGMDGVAQMSPDAENSAQASNTIVPATLEPSQEQTPEPTERMYVKVRSLYEVDGNYAYYEEAAEYIANNTVKDAETPLSMPLYGYDDMLGMAVKNKEDVYNIGYIWLQSDMSILLARGFEESIAQLPMPGIRAMEDSDTCYAAYDLDKGQRVFVFASNDANNTTLGVPVIMEAKRAFADFDGIRQGDEMRSLAKYDPAMNAYADYYYGVFYIKFGDVVEDSISEREAFEMIKLNMEAWKENDNQLKTVHILTDGAMMIKWELDVENGKFVVDSYEFSPEFVLEHISGSPEVEYRIAAIDYVG